ncbi:uncharacterized protein LOC105194038 isoform X2 [Solenopsis invicta]|uniref:uncharacterized protein LOC105194038 isoform X2 n=1 Tax=Solenopsis invicta TaxID=13686 RepID=UPI00193D1F4F|nr:uncharacterized protein LOC105194038 isoform X2 [Solenopsis invicta]
MKKLTMDVLIFLIFVSQVLLIFGKVIIMRNMFFTKQNITFICISENDFGALVWNHLASIPRKIFPEIEQGVHELNELNNNEIICKMNANEVCLESWTKQNWNFTNSLLTPMGPVFDQRWEGFEQYESYYETEFFEVFRTNFSNEVKLSFSVRTFYNTQILICNGKNIYRDSCYWIVINGWNNTQSVIQKCVTGVPKFNKFKEYSEKDSKCYNPLESRKHPLSENEWRTFVITWNFDMGKIILYDTDKIILTYTDEKRDELRSQSDNNYYMFIKNRGEIYFRLHIYDFLHTTVEGATLTSPVFQVNNEAICVQLLVGLCVECDADIVLRDSSNDERLATIVVKGSSKAVVHGLPMWQSVIIKRNLINYSNYSIIIQLIPKLNNRNFNPLWAIANVRQCPQNETIRKNVITFENYYDLYHHINMTCQKLFYNEYAVVSPMSSDKSDVNLDEPNCPLGNIGPKCSISCEHDLHTTFNCGGTKICYEDGCTCVAGFSGKLCWDSCNSNTYGYNCIKTCGSCLYNETLSRNQCDTRTGNCHNGCNNTNTEFYIPPLCQTSVEKPNAPTNISISETTIWAIVPITWKGEYEEISILYSFVIQEHIKYNQQSWNKLFRNMTQVTKYFENMEPGFTYHIRLNLNISGVQIHSDWKVVETKCNPAENFDIKLEENGTIIDLRNIPNQVYSCPEKWYHLVIHNVDTNKEVVSTIVSSFPYYQPLLPFTSYNVVISHKNWKLFSKEIHTFAGITYDSNYYFLASYKGILLANTQLTLIWKTLYKQRWHGTIIQYEVNLKVNEYYGCRDLKLPIPDNHIIEMSTTEPTITIQDLHPYASYTVKVIAHNPRHLIPIVEAIDMTFDTKPTEIPSEVFSQLKIEDWILLWNPPDNCTTILGPLIAKIVIQGISDAVKYFNVIKYSISYQLNLDELNPKLNGFERYLVTLYVIRDYDKKENTTTYEKLEFETPPTAPPEVTNLEVVEIDTRQMPAIHLRWQSPLPPFNGKLHNYGVKYNWTEGYSPIIEVALNETCDLWDDYICKVIVLNETRHGISFFDNIQVFACNVNVTKPGKSVYVHELPNPMPDEPGNYTFTINNNSVVDLKWLHPWKTGSHLEYFRIRIQVISSNLRLFPSLKNEIIKYPVTQYNRTYSKRLYLFPSTRYKIHIEATTITNKSNSTKFVEINTSSAIDFDGILEVRNDDSSSTILINIPSVSNDTQDSMLHIIIKSSNYTCERFSEIPEDLRALASVKVNEMAWQAAEVTTKELAGTQFRVGDNKIYGNALNCPLQPDFYEIVVIITEQNSTRPIMLSKSIRVNNVPPTLYAEWLVAVPIILFILTSIASYLYRRKKQQRNEEQIRNEIALWQESVNCEHETTFTISNRIELMESLSHIYESIPSLRTSTPEALVTATMHSEEEEVEMISLVKVKDFEKYVRQAIQSGLFDKQYKGYKTEKRYIAMQGPEPNTVTDFWRMIWQENVLIICMLTNVVENEKTNCEQYWPNIDKKLKYGDIIVLNEKQNIFADYSFRTFQVTYGEETRKIEHLYYTAWLDYEVPLNTHSVVTYLKKLLSLSPGDGPVVVHYSGVEKTGIIILCDICLRRAAIEGEVDVFAETISIRSERNNMINNKQQYLYAHLVLVECWFSISTTILCNKMLITQIKELKQQSPALQQRLQDTAWQDEILGQDKVSRVYLKKYPISDGQSDYLPAVYVDGVKLQNQYLATQLPIQSTIETFWRMIAEYKVELILMLQPSDLKDPTYYEIVPTSGEFEPTPYLHITAKEVVKEKYYNHNIIYHRLLLVDNFEKPPRKQYVTIMCLTEWKLGKDQSLPPVRSMVTFWQAAEKIARGNGPTVTLCHDGVTGCGLYLALSFLIERMAVENECDVYLAVRAVKRSRTNFVSSLEHLEYLYDAAVTYTEFFEGYANFG